MSQERATWELTHVKQMFGVKPVRGPHWGMYEPGTAMHRYRYCWACKAWRRNPMLRDNKPLIHKGGKP